MKYIQLILALTISTALTAQEYGFGILSDYNTTGNAYEFTFVATPDFTNPDPNFADMQLTIAVTAGNTIEANSFTEILGSGWQVNTALTGSVLQTNFGIGDGSKDIWVFSLPVPTAELSTPHTIGEGIPVLSFVVDNNPSSGMIEILPNDNSIATELAGVGFVVDNLINVDLGDVNGVDDYYGGFSAGSSSVIFSTLSSDDEVLSFAKISVYPNPASSEVFVECNDNYKYELIDINGKSLSNGDINIGINEIPINGLPEGMYFLKLANNNTDHQEKRSG